MTTMKDSRFLIDSISGVCCSYCIWADFADVSIDSDAQKRELVDEP